MGYSEAMERAGLKEIIRVEDMNGEPPVKFDENGIVVDDKKIEEGVAYICNIKKRDTIRRGNKEITIEESDVYCVARVDGSTYVLRVPMEHPDISAIEKRIMRGGYHSGF